MSDIRNIAIAHERLPNDIEDHLNLLELVLWFDRVTTKYVLATTEPFKLRRFCLRQSAAVKCSSKV
jgi:hypothetical protein